MYEKPEVHLTQKYAYIFKTFWLTLFFMPTVPLVILIGLFGLILYYFAEIYLFSGCYKAPNMISARLNQQVMNLFDYSPLWLTLGSFFIFFYVANFNFTGVKTYIFVMHCIALGISLIYLLNNNASSKFSCCTQ